MTIGKPTSVTLDAQKHAERILSIKLATGKVKGKRFAVFPLDVSVSIHRIAKLRGMTSSYCRLLTKTAKSSRDC